MVLFLVAQGCTQESKVKYNYIPPENNIDGLEVSTLLELGLDSIPIVELVDEIYKGRLTEVHSILILKDNKLVFEEYFHGHKYKWNGHYHHGDWVKWNYKMQHSLQSVTKSITSLCIGIAIDQGKIESIHQSIFDYLPDYQYLKKNGRENITIEHLVTMTSGLEWDEWGAPLSSKKNDIVGLWFPNSENIISKILERPIISKPGTEFTYSGGNMILLGEILKNATNLPIDEFSKRYLFEPLGIENSEWTLRFDDGTIESAGGLKLTSRDMAKIGITYLNGGVWKGKKIISEDWVEKCADHYNYNTWYNTFLLTKPPGASSIGGRNGYSYGWWTYSFSTPISKRIDIYYAGGWGGQNIIVIPKLNTIVVFTGGNYTSKTQQFTILKQYILPAYYTNLI